MKPILPNLCKALMIAFLFLSCHIDKIRVTTTIAENSACVREIQIASFDSSLKTCKYPLPVDNSWKQTLEIREGENPFSYLFTKNFANPSEIGHTDSLKQGKFIIVPKFETKFRWFYTLYTYTEIIPAKYHFRYPLKKYLSEEDLLFYLTNDSVIWDSIKKRFSHKLKKGQISAEYERESDEYRQSVEKNFNSWFGSNMIYELKLILKQEIKEKKIELTESEVDLIPEKNDSLIKLIVQMTEKFDLEPFCNYYEAFSGKKLKLSPEISDKLAKKSNDMFTNSLGADITYIVKMPGKITFTNAESNDNQQAKWHINPYALLKGDFVMKVESKVKNAGFIVLFWIFCSIAIAGIAFIIWRKFRQ
jgi:hypothetical protein